MSLIVKKPYGGMSATGSLSNGPGVITIYNENPRTGETFVYERLKNQATTFTAAQIDAQNLVVLGSAMVRIVSAGGGLRKAEFVNEIGAIKDIVDGGAYDKYLPDVTNASGSIYNVNQWAVYVTSMFMRKRHFDFATINLEWALLTAGDITAWDVAADFSGLGLLVAIFASLKTGGSFLPDITSVGHLLFILGHWHEAYTIENSRIIGHGTSPNASNATSWRDYLIA